MSKVTSAKKERSSCPHPLCQESLVLVSCEREALLGYFTKLKPPTTRTASVFAKKLKLLCLTLS
jgi:hypothetical protein